jgi:hypothetical protein
MELEEIRGCGESYSSSSTAVLPLALEAAIIFSCWSAGTKL